VQNYNLSLVQAPGSDFYETYFVVTDKSSGRISKVMVAPDDSKWRSPILISERDTIYFTDGGYVEKWTPRFDTSTLTLHYQLVTNVDSTAKIMELPFNNGWGR
jgi:hypothetical protein